MYNFQFEDGLHWCLSEADLLAFRERCIDCTPRILPFVDRIASLLWLEIWALERRYGVAPYEVLQSIIEVENGEPGAGLKRATAFHGTPLRGLWHKHWFSPRFMGGNLLAAMRRKGASNWIFEVAKEGDILDEATIDRIAHRFTITAFEERWAAKEMTGEWIVYIKRPDGNRYLSVATHTMDDQFIYDTIVNVCRREFPDIVEWIAEAAAS